MALPLFLGGLSFFLIGLKQVGSSLRGMAGKQLRETLAVLSATPVLGFLSGLVVTTVSNSLTLVSVLLVQFVSMGAMPFERCIPVMMGAGVGSTFIGLLVVLNVTRHGLLAFSVAHLLETFHVVRDPEAIPSANAARDNLIYQGVRVTGGLGLLFYGSELMGQACTVDSAALARLSPMAGLLAGALFTAVVQSSGAALGVFLSLAQQGSLDAPTGIGLVLGANVGTCATAVLAAVGNGVAPLRVAVALGLARLVGGLVCCLQVARLQQASQLACGLEGELSAAETSKVIAASHTIFNALLATVIVPLAAPYSRLVVWLVKDPTSTAGKKAETTGVELVAV